MKAKCSITFEGRTAYQDAADAVAIANLRGGVTGWMIDYDTHKIELVTDEPATIEIEAEAKRDRQYLCAWACAVAFAVGLLVGKLL